MGPRWTDPAITCTRSPPVPPATPPVATAAYQEREQERVPRWRHEGAQVAAEVEEAAVGVHRCEVEEAAVGVHHRER
jgi:hypothetical protein